MRSNIPTVFNAVVNQKEQYSLCSEAELNQLRDADI